MKNSLFRALLFWITVSGKYDRLKSDPIKREKSISLGVTGLIMSIVGIALTVGFAYLAYLCLPGMDTAAFLLALVGVIACVAATIGCFIELVLASIVYAVYQMKLNKKPIGLAALIVSLIISVATVVLVIVVLSRI